MVEYVTIVRPVCIEPGCERPQVAHGICRMHYQRLYKAGLLPKRKKNADLATTQVGEEVRAGDTARTSG